MPTPVNRTRFVLKRGIGIYSGNLNNIQYVFQRGTTETQRIYRHWWAAQFMNAYLEFNEMAATEGLTQITNLPIHDKLRVVLTRWGLLSGGGATPMNSHRVFTGIDFGNYIKYHFANPVVNQELGLLYDLLLNGFVFHTIDMGLGYRTNGLWASNRVKDLMYHELAHVSHFNRAGAPFWTDVVYAESYTLMSIGQGPAPYGNGTNGAFSDIISLAESWAEHVAQVFSDIQYRNFFSQKGNDQGLYENNIPVIGLSSHLNAIEDFDPNFNENPFRWIPEGIYYDMLDFRNEFLPIQDEVSGYTNQQFNNSLDNDIKSMQDFRNRLLTENGNNQAATITLLFQRYNH